MRTIQGHNLVAPCYDSSTDSQLVLVCLIGSLPNQARTQRTGSKTTPQASWGGLDANLMARPRRCSAAGIVRLVSRCKTGVKSGSRKRTYPFIGNIGLQCLNRIHTHTHTHSVHACACACECAFMCSGARARARASARARGSACARMLLFVRSFFCLCACWFASLATCTEGNQPPFRDPLE